MNLSLTPDQKEFSDDNLATLRAGFGSIQKVDPVGKTYTALRAGMEKLFDAQLTQLSQARIKWLSYEADRILTDRENGAERQA